MLFNVVLIVETVIAFIIAVTLHEWGHALAAAALGDKQAISEGRLSLAPTRQMAPIGTLVAVVLSFSYAGIGWGRPVRFDSMRLRVGPNVGTILIALAGPLLNLLIGLGLAAGLVYVPGFAALTNTNLATRCAVLGNYGQSMEHCLAGAQSAGMLRLEQFIIVLAVTNIGLAMVNVLPLYPLDAYKIVFALLPSPQAIKFRSWEPYMEAIVLGIFFVIPILLGFIGIAFTPGTFILNLAYRVVVSVAGPAVFIAQLL